MERIEIIGAGYIGLPLAAAFSETMEVVLVEKDADKVRKLQSGEFRYGEKDVDALLRENASKIRIVNKAEPSERLIIAVQTPCHPDGTPDLSSVLSAANDIMPFLGDGSLLVLESTVPVGAGRGLSDALKRSGFGGHFAYCPETILPGNVMKEIKENARVIGSDDPIALSMAKELYQKISHSDIDLCSFEEAELVKLLENAARDVDVAFANQVALIAEREGVDAFSLIEKINKHPRVKVAKPGSGVGGHCIAVDPLFLISKYGDSVPLLSSARKVNDGKPIEVALKAEALCFNKDEAICVFGLSYKPDIGDLRNSSGIAIVRELIRDGYHVVGCEPNTESNEINGILNLRIEEALARASVYVIAQAHKAFLPYAAELKKGRYVDPCGFLR